MDVRQGLTERKAPAEIEQGAAEDLFGYLIGCTRVAPDDLQDGAEPAFVMARRYPRSFRTLSEGTTVAGKHYLSVEPLYLV